MAEHDIDKLNIKLEGEATSAIQVLDDTIGKLTALDSALSKINFSKLSPNFDTGNLKKASSAINSLKNASKNLAGVDTTKFEGNIRSLSKTVNALDIESESINDMKSFASGVRSMVTASTNLNTKIDYNALTDNIQKLTKAIKPLTDEMLRGGSVASNYGTQMKELAQAAKIANSTNKSTQRGGSFYGEGKTFFKLSNYKMLLNIAMEVGREIGGFVDKINSYTEDMNLFTVAMGDYAVEAQKFATKMEVKLGVDSGEAMRYMGVFQQLTTSFGATGDQAAVLSKNLSQLGYDLASFFNLKTDEAFLKLQSGIAGKIFCLIRKGLRIVTYLNGGTVAMAA